MTTRGPILHVLFPTCEMAQRVMVRPQEFYESPIVGIRGKVFDFSEYAKLNAIQNGGVYLYDWTGFNIPGHVVDEFFASFAPLSHGEEMLRAAMSALGSPEKWYLIATAADDPDADTLAHEICHARWYLDPNFHDAMAAEVLDLQQHEPGVHQAFREWLLNRGYDESVLADECQAYLATTPGSWWTTKDAGGMTEGFAGAMWRAGAPFRGIAEFTSAVDVVRYKMPQG